MTSKHAAFRQKLTLRKDMEMWFGYRTAARNTLSISRLFSLEKPVRARLVKEAQHVKADINKRGLAGFYRIG
jgi:hypothetical protein